MKAMILAAGKGTRLQPLTNFQPKALVEVNGKPLIEILIQRLKKFGFNEIIINLHHFQNQIISFLEKKNFFDTKIEFSFEENLLETGGGLLKASHFFFDKKPFLLHNVDVLSEINLLDFYEKHCENKALATLAVQEKNSDRYLHFDEQNFLCAWQNVSTNELRKVRNPNGNLKIAAFSGIHVVDPKIFDLITQKNCFSIIETYLNLAPQHKIAPYFYKENTQDVGKISSILQTSYLVDSPTFTEIKESYEKIKPYISQTPVLSSQNLNEILGAELFFKCENFQKTGSFKIRGATNAVFSLSEAAVKQGIITHSSGNHAAAVAFAAKLRETKSYIVMPENSPEVKKESVKNYGAEVYFCEPTLSAREEILKLWIEKTGANFIHPYDNVKVICGQGTISLEFLEQVSNLEILLIPVSGGGLLSGNLIAAKALKPDLKIFGVEPQGANDAFLSFYEKKLIKLDKIETIADGLRASLSPLTFNIISKLADGIVTVSEGAILCAMYLLAEKLKIVAEPSSAVPLAALLENKLEFKNKKVGIIVSGGNIDLKNYWKF